MVNFTSNTYQMKREILSFSNKISKNLPKPEKKFMADMNYGILASGSCLLTDIVDQLHEPSRKINIVDRLSKHLAKGTSEDVLRSYLAQVKKWCPEHPVVHIDDSDVVKPDGYKFESLGWVPMVLKVLQQRIFIKKDIMLQKLLSLPIAIIRSVSSLKFILLKRRISHPSIR